MASPFFLVWTLSALINKERLRLFFLAFIIQQKPRGLESYLSFFHLSKRHSEPRERKIPHPHQTGTISGSSIQARCHPWYLYHAASKMYESYSMTHPHHVIFFILFFNEEFFEHLEDENKLSLRSIDFHFFFWVATRSVNRCLFWTRAN